VSKRILVVGQGSYIGESFARYAKDIFTIDVVDSRNDKWQDVDFSGYDTILHCAGIAHVAQKKNMRELYYAINCQLAVTVAQKAKNEGVGQFVFLSSMSVYHHSQKEITKDTPPNPICFYGGSKLAAEKQLQQLATSSLKMCIVRPPMVYGAGCKGNFPRIVTLTRRLPIFPNINNRRSMIYIDNLCEFFVQAIDSEREGVYLPQNEEWVNTTKLVKLIAKAQGKNIFTTKIFNPAIKLLSKSLSQFGKLFGNLYYAQTGDEHEYNKINFSDSIKASVTKE